MKVIAKRRHRGYALMTILLLGVLLMALAGAIGSEVLSGLSTTKTRVSDSTARFAAHAGLQHAMLLLRENSGYNEDLEAVMMPGSNGVSYTVWICNNSTNEEQDEADDGTIVPPFTIYFAAMGVDNSSGEVVLHAMSGMLSERKPVIQYGAFSDKSIDLQGSSESLSFVPGEGIEIVDGRAVPNEIGSGGDLGTNRDINLASTVQVAGNIFHPLGGPANTIELATNITGDDTGVRPLESPVTLPKFSSPGGEQGSPTLDSVEGISGVSTTVVTATQGQTAVVDTLDTPFQQDTVMEPGRYFFPGDLDIDGVFRASENASAEDPVILFVGGSAHFGSNARVNLDGQSSALQFYFVDRGGDEAQTFQMIGDSQFFGTVVGNRVEGVFQDNAELFGGFMGRSVTASGHAKIYFDESLAATTLAVAANWGLNGITEPKPEVVLFRSALAREYVAAVKNQTVTYQTAFQAVPKNTQSQ